MMPRGIRNKNPGNIRRSTEKWMGLDSRQLDRDFFQFVTHEYGIRAMARIILTYQDKYGLNTVRKIIDRWAPPHENNTGAYARAVAKAMGVKLDDALDVKTHAVMLPLVKAIIRHENGIQPFEDVLINKGLALAGLEPNEETPHA